MFGGTEADVSREIGPVGKAVTGTSISEAGVPRRYRVWLGESMLTGEAVTLRQMDVADSGRADLAPMVGPAVADRVGMSSLGRCLSC